MSIFCFPELISEQKRGARNGKSHGENDRSSHFSTKTDGNRSGTVRITPQMKHAEHTEKGEDKHGKEVKLYKSNIRSSTIQQHNPLGARSRYKWVGTSSSKQQQKGTDLNKGHFNVINRTAADNLSQEQLRLALLDPAKSKTTSRENMTKTHGNIARQTYATKQDKTESTQNMKDDIKIEAVQFLKEKLSKKKVHINKHHAAFRNTGLATCDRLNAKKETSILKQDMTDRMKSAAVKFLKEAGVGTNRVNKALLSISGASRTPPSTANNIHNYKLDRRPSYSSSSKEVKSTKNPEARNFIARTRHKLVRTYSVTPQNNTTDIFPRTEKLKPEFFSSKDKHTRFKYVRSTSSLGSSNNSIKQGNQYKFVKNKPSSSAQATFSHAVKTQEGQFLSSKYKLVKKIESSDTKQHTTQLRTSNQNSKYGSVHKRKRASLSKYKWTKFESKLSQRQQLSLTSVEKSPTSSTMSKTVNTPRSIKMKTRFKLVRKALKTTQGKLLALDKKSPSPYRRIKNSKYKLVNDKHSCRAPLVWKNRFALRRHNTAGKYLLPLCR